VTSYFGQRSRVSERRPKQQIIRAWLFLSSGVARLAISVREVQGQDPNSSFFSDNLRCGTVHQPLQNRVRKVWAKFPSSTTKSSCDSTRCLLQIEWASFDKDVNDRVRFGVEDFIRYNGSDIPYAKYPLTM
jgi:hypothetical protein